MEGEKREKEKKADIEIMEIGSLSLNDLGYGSWESVSLG